MRKLILRICLLLGIIGLASSPALAGPLHDAVKAGDLDEVKHLIASGADVNAPDKFHNLPLYWAATRGHVAIAEELIAHGANINAKDRSGATALHVAASTGQVALLEFLISKGAQVDIKDQDGRTPLHRAAYTGQSATADALIAGGADVNARTREHLTPLHLAVPRGHKQVAELLIARGAKVNIGDVEGVTPLQWAVNIGHTDIVELLKRHGGKRRHYDTVCHRLTPLPSDARVRPPAANVPDHIARFSGAWSGAWRRGENPRALCTALLVEDVHPNGFAQVVYSHGYYEPWDIRYPGYFRAIGRVMDDELQLPTPDGNLLAYQPNGGELHATYNRQGRAVVAKTEQSQIECTPLANTPRLARQPPDKRDGITREELRSPAYVPDAPVHNDYFKPLGRPNPPLHAFEGNLTLVASRARTAQHGCRGADITIPQVTLGFMTVGEDLVPSVRDIIHSPETAGGFELIISPGKVWSEPADGGMSRAAFPFVLASQVSNETHNGIATFLYNEEEVSALRFQIVQETAGWARADIWGQAALRYTPGPIEGRDRLAKRFAMERAAELPIRSWEELSQRLTRQLSGNFAGAWAREHISATGLVVDGVIYMPPCRSRYGDLPYCRHMRHGVFSVTKSMGAALTLLRLAQKYGPEVFDLKIKDYVTVTADHTGWDEVSFANTLNMAVGVGEHSPKRFPLDIAADAEDRSERFLTWLLERPTRAGKLRLAFEFPNYPWGPGEVARYDTTHTFVLAAAMDGFYKSKEGPNADLWGMVQTEVLEPIGVFHAPIMRTVEPDGSRGLPIFGYGFYPTIEDAAKIAMLFQNEGRHNGKTLLYPPSTREALYRTAQTGLATGGENRYGSEHYHLSFWSEPYQSKDGCFFQIPHMVGYGGNLVVLMPNGINAFRFADEHNYEIESMVLAAESVKPFCPPGSIKSALKTRKGTPLTMKALRSLIPGSTMYHENKAEHDYYAPNGTVFSASEDKHRLGNWRIDETGHLCIRKSTERGGDETCFRLYRDGDDLVAEATNHWRILNLKLVRGNPEGY